MITSWSSQGPRATINRANCSLSDGPFIGALSESKGLLYVSRSALLALSLSRDDLRHRAKLGECRTREYPRAGPQGERQLPCLQGDRKSTRLNSSHVSIS